MYVGGGGGGGEGRGEIGRGRQLTEERHPSSDEGGQLAHSTVHVGVGGPSVWDVCVWGGGGGGGVVGRGGGEEEGGDNSQKSDIHPVIKAASSPTAQYM